jgi:hypothetical protein
MIATLTARKIVLECFQWMLFDTLPILASWELRLSLPCREDLWKCASKSQWDDLASIPETCIAFPIFHSNRRDKWYRVVVASPY